MVSIRNTILSLIALNLAADTANADKTIDRPHTKTFSWEYSNQLNNNENTIFTVDGNFDLGASYELPVYT